jgi:hypothetical protein
MNKIVCYLLLIFLLAGCATVPTVKEYDKIPPDEVLIFGQIKSNRDFFIFLKQNGLFEEKQSYISGDGYFYWRLKHGTYTVTRFEVFQGVGRIWVTFEVPKDANRAVYIGTLHIRLGAISTVRVEDNFDTAIEILKKRFSLTEVSASKSLMKKEEMR